MGNFTDFVPHFVHDDTFLSKTSIISMSKTEF